MQFMREERKKLQLQEAQNLEDFIDVCFEQATTHLYFETVEMIHGIVATQDNLTLL